ncbi:sialidase family protein [Paraburkholderia sp. 40]|uniref:sialidase family protein n=1 Tax=Paraburkholderia sp. 40 TaxID=2991059 RepID=UPI003D1BF820
MANIQVTRGASPNDARSESSLAINPNNPLQLVAASRKCKDIAAYDFTSATVYSTDAGITWHDSANLATPDWTGVSDPALAWDDSGNIFLVCAAIRNPPAIDYVGIAVYRSFDGGQTWSAPSLIHASAEDEKPWVAGDAGSSAFHGCVYAAWDDGVSLRFARTLDHGITWIGIGTDPAGSILASDTPFSPEINVAADGTIYIAWTAGSEIKMMVSSDGGNSFHPVASPATGITTLESSLPPWKPHGWPVLPGGTFRVFTLPTACVSGQTVLVAWADYREGVSRIYYALSTNGGAGWDTAPSGRPLLTGALAANQQYFHPQIIANPKGVIGCAFYEFGPKASTYLIDVIMAQSFDGGVSFNRFTVTDRPWDPTIDAPVSLVDPIASFIGEYFGLDASTNGFYPLWTDTRTGIQELWMDIVPPHPQVKVPSGIYGQVAQILFGIIQDGGGDEIVGGHLVHISPWGPELDILLGVAIQRIATLVANPEGVKIQKAAMTMVTSVAHQEIGRLEVNR